MQRGLEIFYLSKFDVIFNSGCSLTTKIWSWLTTKTGAVYDIGWELCD